MKKKLMIINTGGTIGMRSTDQGFRPAQDFLQTQMELIPELADDSMPQYTIHEYNPVIDSANMTPDHWQRIANDIQKFYNQYDAFLVLHGTDTMAYTSSALPLMLSDLNKTVIITGSQLPLCWPRNDARENLITAMIIASEYHLPEVCVYFGSRLLRGCRTTKISTASFDAFDSPNDPPLGLVGTNIRIFQDRIRPSARTDGSALSVNPIQPAMIANFRLFPGVSVDILQNVLQSPLQALVLETYGAGNGPSSQKDFLKVLRDATDRGVVVVNLSQCRQGGVSPTDYATGRALADVGVTSGRDSTIESAITKLMYLFSQQRTPGEVKIAMGQNLVGEISE